MASDVTIRPVGEDDFDGWAKLFRRYRDFYNLDPDEAVVKTVWGWLMDPAHEVNSLVAVSGEKVVGIADYRKVARPSSGGYGLYLDDLYTAPAVRGKGVGRALLTELSQMADREGMAVIRWITAEDNYAARRLYDSVGATTRWVSYDLKPGTL